jgi:protease secretion system membrane fusion protein
MPPPLDDASLLDTRGPMRIGLWVLAAGLGGFLAWAALAPLDEGVPTQGSVAIDTKRKAVQHQVGGIVKQVLVKEGQIVRAGDPLVLLDDAAAVASSESVRQHYLTLRAAEGRLQAEQSSQPKIIFHPDLARGSNEYARQAIGAQEQLFRSRRASLQAELQAIAESIKGAEASIAGFDGMLGARKAQLASIEEDLKGLRDLVKEGYAPRNKLLEFERMSSEAMASISDILGNSQRLRSSIAELRMRAIQRTQEYRKEVDTQLAEVRREVQADADKHRAASEELGRTVIRAPSEGQVVGLAVQTVGGVVTPGQKLMDIVPASETLLLETRVPPHLIDRVAVGATADARFSGFAHTPQLVVEGRIASVSADLLQEPNQPPYYLARVTITPEGIRKLGNRVMQPGMPVEVIVKTGERSLLTYLLHPLVKRMAAAMKEE